MMTDNGKQPDVRRYHAMPLDTKMGGIGKSEREGKKAISVFERRIFIALALF